MCVSRAPGCKSCLLAAQTMVADITGALALCHRQERALILCVLIRRDLGAFISTVIFKDDILALQARLLFQC